METLEDLDADFDKDEANLALMASTYFGVESAFNYTLFSHILRNVVHLE